MKKIMFNDRYGLTKAVLEGRKTMTRRIVRHPEEVEINGHKYLKTEKILYKVGEVVAVAQRYCDVYDHDFAHDFGIDLEPGWRNKMFVAANEMPHQIRIANARVERLQDIRDVDCLREGVINYTCNLYEYQGTCYSFVGDKSCMGTYKTPQQAFAALIDKVSGKGTWESNPWVIVYGFELEK